MVLKAVGELDLHTQDEFERVLGELLAASPVVVDLSDIEFFAICALRSLIVCHRLAASSGHEVFYAEPSRQMLKLISLSGLSDVLPLGSPPVPTASVA